MRRKKVINVETVKFNDDGDPIVSTGFMEKIFGVDCVIQLQFLDISLK